MMLSLPGRSHLCCLRDRSLGMVQIHGYALLLVLRFPFGQTIDLLLHGLHLLLPIMVLGDKDARREQYEKSDRSPPRTVWMDEHVDNFVFLAGCPVYLHKDEDEEDGAARPAETVNDSRHKIEHGAGELCS